MRKVTPEKEREYRLRYQAKHPERRAETVKRCNLRRREAAKLWRLENAERLKAYHAAYRDKKNAARRANREKTREYERKMRLLFPEKHRAKKAFRRAQQKKATPPWVDRKQLQAVYRKAVRRKKHVDHIVPLVHPRVCGLHVPWNLQLLSHIENVRKGNRIDLDARAA